MDKLNKDSSSSWSVGFDGGGNNWKEREGECEYIYNPSYFHIWFEFAGLDFSNKLRSKNLPSDSPLNINIVKTQL